MGEHRPSAKCGFFIKTSDLVHPIQHNHDKKDVFLSSLMRRIDKAFEFPLPSLPEQSMCGLPEKICNSPIIDEDTAFKDNVAVKVILIVATIIESFDVVLCFRKELWKLLEAVYKLAKTFHQLKDFPILNHLHEIKNTEADSMICTIFDGLRRCFFPNRKNEHDRLVLNRTKYEKDIKKCFFLVNEAQQDLATQMLVCILLSEKRRPQREDEAQSETKDEEEDKLINEKREEVTTHLFLEKNDEQSAAAVILRGKFSTNVGDAVDEHLKALHFERGFKFAKVRVAENLGSNQDKEALQRQILDDLIGKDKHNGKNIRHLLRDIIEKEPVFIYIDNVVSTLDLRSIFDVDIMHPKKFRLLITSPNKNVPSAFEGWFKVKIKELDVDNPEIGDDPLLREMVTDYLKRCSWTDKETVSKWVDEPNLVEKGFRFALENAFLNLGATAQDAFLDICSFFLGWDFHEVSSIVGEAEIETLEQNGWVKRNRTNRIGVSDRALSWGLLRTKGVRLTSEDDLKGSLSSAQQIKGIWLVGKAEKPVKIPDKMLELMSDSVRVILFECVELLKDPAEQNPMASSKAQFAEKQLKFLSLRFLHVDRCTVPFPFHLNHLCNLKYLSCGEHVNFNVPEELQNLRIHRRSSKLDMRSLKLKTAHSASESHDYTPFTKLRELSINVRWSNMTLPQSLSQLHFLQKLDLHDCRYLKELPNTFGNLRRLEKLDLGFCKSLRRLPETVGELQCLEELILTSCVALEELPVSFVWLGNLKKAIFSDCQSLKKLPPTFELLSSLQEADFSYCINLEFLPINFQLLSCLQLLKLQGCTKLETLPDSLPESLLKSELVAVNICGCSALTELPEQFCQGNQIQDLSLAGCIKLERLPDDINELKRLRKLNLSGCEILAQLPKNFRELSCLETLNLSSCTKLLSLCHGFNRLKALKDLNISYCPSLHGRWMSKLVKIRSLRLVDIRGSDKLNGRWLYSTVPFTMLDRLKWSHLTVLTDQIEPADQGKEEEDNMQAVLDNTAYTFFEESASLIDPYGMPFFPSREISPNHILAFIFDRNISRWDREMLKNNVDELIRNLSGMHIIYVGKSFGAIPSKLAEMVSAYTPENSPVLSLFDKPLSISAGTDFWDFGTYIIKTTVVKANNGYMYFRDWESISGKLFK